MKTIQEKRIAGNMIRVTRMESRSVWWLLSINDEPHGEVTSPKHGFAWARENITHRYTVNGNKVEMKRDLRSKHDWSLRINGKRVDSFPSRARAQEYVSLVVWG